MDWMISSDHPSANIPLAILLAVGALGPLPLYPLESGCTLPPFPPEIPYYTPTRLCARTRAERFDTVSSSSQGRKSLYRPTQKGGDSTSKDVISVSPASRFDRIGTY